MNHPDTAAAVVVTTPPDTTGEPVQRGAGDGWGSLFADIAEWLIEYRSNNTRVTYAAAVGYPWHPVTGAERRVDRMLGGHAWLPYCAARGVHPYDVDRRDVLTWLDTLADAGLSRATRAGALSAVSAFYTWAVEFDRLDCTPVVVNRRRLEVTWPSSSTTRSLSLDEFAAMVRTAGQWRPRDVAARNKAILALLGTVGVRVSELVGLDRDDFTVDDGRRVVVIRGKGDTQRRAYVDEWVWSTLLAYWAQCDRGELVTRDNGDEGRQRAAFETRTGGRISANEVRRMVKRTAQRAGVDDPGSVFPHAIRHSVVTQARRLGVSLEEIQRQLGHASPATTQRYGDTVTNWDASPARAIGATLAARVDT